MVEPISAERWGLLLTAIEKLRAARSMDDAVQIIRFTARTIVDADGITVVRRIGSRVHYVAEDAIGPLWTGHDFPMEQCVSGLAILTQAPVLISDIRRDARVPYHLYADTFVGSMAMFPVGLREPVAAIGAYWRRPGTIADEAQKLLESLSRAMGTVLYNLDTTGPATEYRASVRRNWGAV